MNLRNSVTGIFLIPLACILLVQATPIIQSPSSAQPLGKVKGVVVDLRDARVAQYGLPDRTF